MMIAYAIINGLGAADNAALLFMALSYHFGGMKSIHIPDGFLTDF